MAPVKFRMPHELAKVDVDLLRRTLPDVTVTIIQSENNIPQCHCHKVKFRVTLSPGLFAPTGYQTILWEVIDRVNGIATIPGSGTVSLAGTGGSATITFEFPLPPDANFTPDWDNQITVRVNSDYRISERNHLNNEATFIGHCVG